MPNRRGFTLVELLVVIGIIGILVSILLPTIAKSQRLAMRTKCASQLRQIGLAFQCYANDYQQAVPDVLNAPGLPGAPYQQAYLGRGLANLSLPTIAALENYGLSRTMWYCPANTERNTDANWVFQQNVGSQAEQWAVLGYFTFLYRIELYPPYAPSGSPSSSGSTTAPYPFVPSIPTAAWAQPLHVYDHWIKKMSEPHASETTLAADNSSLQDVTGFWSPSTNHILGNNGQEGGNVMFLDCHVEWRDKYEMVNDFWYTNYQYYW